MVSKAESPRKVSGEKVRVEGEVVSQDRMKGRGITDGLVLVRGIRFLFHRHFRMSLFKIIIQEGDMPDKPRPFVMIANLSA